LCRPEAVVYRLLGTRSAAGAATVLGDYRGIVLCDGYAAYRALAKRGTGERAGPTLTLAHCWAHVRRQYLEAEPSYPQAVDVLALIGELYAAESAAQATAPGDRDAGHRHAPARSPWRAALLPFKHAGSSGSPQRPTGHGEHVRVSQTLGASNVAACVGPADVTVTQTKIFNNSGSSLAF